jgi:nicotinamide-nucleotide amidase
MSYTQNESLTKMAEQVLNHLRQHGLQIVTAESCTGGMITGCLTEIAGSSDVVQGGFVTYSNDMKISALGVSESDLQIYGAVSETVAKQMSEGALRIAKKANLAVSVTGVAGPSGGTADKPVGMVCFGLSRRLPDNKLQTHTFTKYFGELKRADIRQKTIEVGFRYILQQQT